MYCDYIQVYKIFLRTKHTYTFDKGAATELSLDVAMDTNPSYSITNHNQEPQYDYAYHKEYSPQENAQDIIRMESNPAYVGFQDCNSVIKSLPDLGYSEASIHPYLSHSSNLETIKASGDEDEDQHGYVKTVQGADYLQLFGSATKSANDVATDI